MPDDMFLDLKGIEGESKDQTFSKIMDITGFSWGVSNAGSGGYGGGSGVGKVSVGDVSVMKRVDKASAYLIGLCAQGKHIDSGTIHVRKAGGDNPLEYLTYTMNEVFITSVQQSDASGADVAQESISLNFSKIQVSYKVQSSEGADDATSDVTLDIKQNAFTIGS
jgi:type VI secretion system secreted protein Hcp